MQTTTTAAPPETAEALTYGQLALVTLGRLALTTAFRIAYPLLPFLSERFQVNLQTVSLLITVQVLASFVSPLGGALTDTRGGRATMSLGLGLFCLGALVCALVATFGGFLAGYALIGLSVALYQPAAQAYLSARTHYSRRGTVLGIYELSWAAAAILGVTPLMLLVEQTQSKSPVFWVMLLVGLLSLALLRVVLPPANLRQQRPGTRFAWGVLRLPRVLAMFGLLVLALCAIDLLFVVQGPWLKANFGADDAQLGQVFALMGIAEFAGALGSALIVDRLGKKRSVLAGYALTALAAVLLPFSDGSWLLYLPLLFVFDFAFEFAIVSSFPLASGLAPAARGTVLALAVTAVGIGRAAGATLAEPLWSQFGMLTNGLIAAVLLGAGVLLCLRFVHETEGEEE